ncbi:MAG: hypothetical protein JKY37_34500, partial [Nannocystaceae bacterium]|nr:hypothetical protein [Nannocystaceae bacterium]
LKSLLQEKISQDVTRGRVPLAVLRVRLVVVALRLAREQAPVGDAPKARLRLSKLLSSLPLLELSTGRLVSLAVVRRERPRELWHLGLWDGEQTVLDEIQGGGPPPVAPPVPSPPEPRVSKPRPPTREQRLVEAIRSELRLVRERNRELLSDAQLDGITVETRDGALVVVPDNPATIDASHPLVARVLRQADGFEPVAISFLVSAVYTAINIKLSEITDSNEAAFLALHAEYLASAHRV